jgi:hypothetical protein
MGSKKVKKKRNLALFGHGAWLSILIWSGVFAMISGEFLYSVMMPMMCTVLPR